MLLLAEYSTWNDAYLGLIYLLAVGVGSCSWFFGKWPFPVWPLHQWVQTEKTIESEVIAFYNSNTGVASPHHGHIHWVRKLLMRKELTKTSISEVRSHHHHDGAHVIKWLWKLNTIMNVKFQAWDLANSRHSIEVIHIFLLSWYRSHSWPKIYISKNSLLQGSQVSLFDTLIRL